MKYIDAEKLTKAIEDKGLDCSFALKMERLDTLALIDELQQEQPSLPSNLDKAAEEYADYNSRRWQEDGDIYYDHSKIMDAFKAGAKWMAKQGVYAYCIESSNPVSESPDKKYHSITLTYEENENTPYVRAGDRVKVILRKI